LSLLARQSRLWPCGLILFEIAEQRKGKTRAVGGDLEWVVVRAL
jgi:hypothetical protein